MATVQYASANTAINGVKNGDIGSHQRPSFLPPKQKTLRQKIETSVRYSPSSGMILMGIRAIESFDSSFELIPECQDILFQLLESETFRNQVAKQPGMAENTSVTFSGILFQPVPWSVTTKFGMPQEYEKYLEDKDNYVIVNIPPNYMFQAKIFKPSRLCAIFKKETA